MSRRRPASHLVTLDGVIAVPRPSMTRAAALRSKGWWQRRLGIGLDVVRIKGMPA